MKKLLLLLTAIILFANEAILKLDTKGHTGLIKDIIVTKSGDIISASDDKTIRVWDIDGREKRKILGEIGAGSFGMIYAIALSPDERYLAVGGYLAKPGYGESGNIRIYNYKTGKLLKLLKSHTDIINDLAFSKDGRYLVSGSDDKSVKVWRVGSFELIKTINVHNNFVYGVGMIGDNVVSVGFDNKISIYNLKDDYEKYSKTLPYKLRYIAINPIRQHIAVCGFGREIKIYDYHLNLITTIYSKTKPTGLKYSKDGRYLIAGSRSDFNYELVNIYSTYNYSLYNSFKKHNNSVFAVNFYKNYAISGGGENNEIYIWDKDTKKIKTKIAGVGGSIWSVGIDGDRVAWGNSLNPKNQNNKGPLEKEINLKTFQISKATNYYHRISTTNGNYSLTHSKGGDYGYYDAVLNIKYQGRIISKIVKHSYDGYRHRCYGWYKNYIISGGANGLLKVYDLQGQEVASLIGHTGEIWSIAIDGDRLVSGSDDQTIKVWDLSKLPQKEIYPLLSIFVSKDNQFIVWSKSGYFNSSVGGAKYIGYHINQGDDKEARWVSVDKYFDKFYRPDIISNILKTNSEELAIKFASRDKKVQKVDILNQLPPEVILLSDDNIKTTKNSITIKYKITSNTPAKIIVLRNGEKIIQRGLKIDRNYKTLTIPLDDGLNIISLKAKNRYAMSDEVIIKATKTTTSNSIYKPNLYILSIGVSKYKNPEYNLKVANKDAKSIVDIFKHQKIFKNVYAKLLTNNQATKDNILDALDWIDREVTQKDMAIIFIAGHGINDERGNYYFLPYNANLDRLRRSSVRWGEFQDTITNLPSKVILFADTCHSGAIMGMQRRDVTSAIKSIISSGSGTVIFAATGKSGYSYENPRWGHGAFTKAIIEGLKLSKADYNNDGEITIKELDLYITNEVKRLTNGKQKPTTIIPDSIPDFAIGVRQ